MGFLQERERIVAKHEEEEAALEKTGPELFKELYRVYPVAEVEDYFKNGGWRNDVMKKDLVMIRLHRREAGSPAPLPMEEIKFPELPKETVVQSPVLGLAGGIRPGLAGAAAIRPAGATATPAAAVVRPAGVGTTAAGTAVPGAGGAVAELRLIALFVAKWKLDPTKTKTMLAKTTSPRRRYVIQNFKTANTGEEAVTDLETYIAECEASGDWDKPSGPMAALANAKAPSAGATIRPAGTVPAAATAVGVKRPISAVSGAVATPGAAVRPALAAAAGYRPGAVRPAVAAVRPAAVFGVRPALRPTIAPAAGGVGPKAAGVPKAKAGSVISGLLKKF